jgi:hypothetical protein
MHGQNHIKLNNRFVTKGQLIWSELSPSSHETLLEIAVNFEERKMP